MVFQVKNGLRFLFFMFILTLVVLISGCTEPENKVYPSAPLEDVKFRLKPEFIPNVPVRFLDLLNKTDIIVLEDGKARAKATDRISAAAGVNWEKGTVGYYFNGTYDQSKKQLSGKIHFNYSTKETGKDGPYCTIEYHAELDLNATFVSEDEMEGRAVGEATSVQTFLGEFGTNAPPETNSWKYDWAFRATR